jgi:pectin methylesterase-like acyl-CoA thioesterase
MGIISTNPAIVGNNKQGVSTNPNYKIVAMIGQIPARASNENGQINIGDSVTPASRAGYVMKSRPGDPTIGTAIENLSSDSGLIQVMIARHNKSVTVEQVETEITKRIAEMEIENEVSRLVKQATDNLQMSKIFDLSLAPTDKPSITFDANGNVKVKRIVAEESGYAESFSSLDILSVGDVVVVDSNNAGYVKKSLGSANETVVGVVTDTAGFVSGSADNKVKVMIAGKAKVKVTPANGLIVVGDSLTTAPITGTAMKQLEVGNSLSFATALSNYDSAVDGWVEVLITLGGKQIAQVKDNQLEVISMPGKIAMSALPQGLAKTFGDNQTFENSIIFGSNKQTSSLVVFNSKVGSDIEMAVDGEYSVGSATAGLKNIFSQQMILKGADSQVDLSAQDLRNYGLYLSADTGNAYFGDGVVIGGDITKVSISQYPQFALGAGDLYVSRNAGFAGDLYVAGSMRIAGAVEFDRQAIAQRMTTAGSPTNGDVVVINSANDYQARISTNANDVTVLGVVTDNSAIVMGGATGTPVVTAGLVKVKATSANGAITKGAKLTTSNIAGRVMLATKPGAGLVGTAMSDLTSGEAEIDVLVTLGTYFQPQARIITVAQSGGDFSSIVDAIESITDASAQQRYVVKVAPGIYNEQVVLKPFVELIGESTGSVTMTGSAPVVTIVKDSRLESVTVELSSDNGNAILLSGDNLESTAGISEVVINNKNAISATAILVSGQFNTVNISDLKLTGSFDTGIGMISSSTLQISNSDLVEVIGSALSVNNGQVVSRRNEFAGVLTDIYVGAQAKVVSSADVYEKLTTDGIFVDNTVAGKVNDSYFDYGWLVQADVNNSSNIEISAGAGSVAGAKIITGINQTISIGSGNAYVLMTADGTAVVSEQPTLTDVSSLVIAKITYDLNGQMVISNDRSNELVVAKEGGQYRTISEALEAITSNTADNRWTIVVKPGTYLETINLKPFVSIIGSSPLTTKVISTGEPTLLADYSNVTNATSTASSFVSDLSLQLNGDVVGQPVASINNAGVKFERVNFNWVGEQTDNSSAVSVTGAGQVDLLNVNMTGSVYGVKQTTVVDGSNANINLAYSNVNASVGVKTICELADGTVCAENSVNPLTASVTSAYTIYYGATAFDISAGTAVATSHDTYASYVGKGKLINNDYNRNLVDPNASIFSLQNAGNQLFNVNADGRVTINLQNTAGDGVVINGTSTDSVLKVVNNGTGPALTVVGDLVVTSSSAGQAAITAMGGTLQIGKVGDVIDLSVNDVTYKFKENVRRNVLSAFVDSPVAGDKVWGGEGNSWTPPENIEVLGFKMQYKCSADSLIKLVLKDKSGNVIAHLDSKNCSDYGSIGVDNLRLPISTEDGLYVEFMEALGEVKNVTITVEFVYENR